MLPYKWPYNINISRDVSSSSLKRRRWKWTRWSWRLSARLHWRAHGWPKHASPWIAKTYQTSMVHFCFSVFHGNPHFPKPWNYPHSTPLSSTISVPINTHSASEPVLLNIHTCFVLQFLLRFLIYSKSILKNVSTTQRTLWDWAHFGGWACMSATYHRGWWANSSRPSVMAGDLWSELAWTSMTCLHSKSISGKTCIHLSLVHVHHAKWL